MKVDAQERLPHHAFFEQALHTPWNIGNDSGLFEGQRTIGMAPLSQGVGDLEREAPDQRLQLLREVLVIEPAEGTDTASRAHAAEVGHLLDEGRAQSRASAAHCGGHASRPTTDDEQVVFLSDVDFFRGQ